MNTPKKKYWEMNCEELEEATKQFDQEFIEDQAKPLTPAQQAQENRARLKQPGRPKIGKGAKKIHISMENGLLKATDRAAKKRGMKRSELISTVLASALMIPSKH
jgi:hypothetical protein